MRSRWRNAFDVEFTSLVALEVKSMANDDFLSVANFMIGSRPAGKPPLIQDFRDARINQEKLRLRRDVDGANRAMNTQWHGGLQAYLSREFPGCKTLNEAVEVRKLQIQIAKAKDPNYDPMTDRKWM